jgi:hypothetical protein
MEINMPVNNSSEVNLYSFNEKYWDSVGRYMWERWVAIRVLVGTYDVDSISYSEEDWVRLQYLLPPVLTGSMEGWSMEGCTTPSLSALADNASAKQQWSWAQTGVGKYGVATCSIIGTDYQARPKGSNEAEETEDASAEGIIKAVARTQLLAIAAVLGYVQTLANPTAAGAIAYERIDQRLNNTAGPQGAGYRELGFIEDNFAAVALAWHLVDGPQKNAIKTALREVVVSEAPWTPESQNYVSTGEAPRALDHRRRTESICDGPAAAELILILREAGDDWLKEKQANEAEIVRIRALPDYYALQQRMGPGVYYSGSFFFEGGVVSHEEAKSREKERKMGM